MKKSKLARRITWRVILIMVIFNVFIIGAVFIFHLAMSEVESEMRAQYMIDRIDGKLTAVLDGAEITATNCLAEFEANLSSPEKLYDAMEQEFRKNNRYLGFGIGFEPDYFASKGRWFEPYVTMTDSTHVERKQIGSAEHDYFNQEWFVKGRGLKKGEGYLTDPYFDKDGAKCLLSTYSTPFFDGQGRLAGVFGIDLNLNWIEQTVIEEENKIKEREFLDDDPDNPGDVKQFFIQVLDSKGKKIVGSEEFDEKTLKTILEKDSTGFQRANINDESYFFSSKRIASTGWIVVVALHQDFAFLNGYGMGIIILFFMTLGGIVIFFFTGRSIKRAIKPLHTLSDSAQEVAHGNFDTPLPTFKYQDEIAQLRDSFETMQQSLTRYVQELKESTAAKASIESELNVAHSIQMSMLPKIFPPFPHRDDIELYAIQNPAKAVGGDLYDYFIRDEKLFFCIGDVSGKGVPASLVMAVSRTLFRNVAAHNAEPKLIVKAMNEAICEGNDYNMFVTLFIGVLDLKTGHLSYCNAGHDAPYIQGSKLPCDSNLPIGVVPDWSFTEQEAMMQPNSTIFLYTDGLTEAENTRHEQFGEQRVTDVVSPFTGSPQQLIEAMTAAVHLFVGDTEQSDDLTMLAIKYTQTKPE